jgi:hypothetical protein
MQVRWLRRDGSADQPAQGSDQRAGRPGAGPRRGGRPVRRGLASWVWLRSSSPRAARALRARSRASAAWWAKCPNRSIAGSENDGRAGRSRTDRTPRARPASSSGQAIISSGGGIAGHSADPGQTAVYGHQRPRPYPQPQRQLVAGDRFEDTEVDYLDTIAHHSPRIVGGDHLGAWWSGCPPRCAR